jgi:hypothetical protein
MNRYPAIQVNSLQNNRKNRPCSWSLRTLSVLEIVRLPGRHNHNAGQQWKSDSLLAARNGRRSVSAFSSSNFFERFSQTTLKVMVSAYQAAQSTGFDDI